MTLGRPWMPLYIADYLLDTRDLDADQHGIYLLLLMLAWRQPDGQIPDDQTFIRANLPRMHGLTYNRLVCPILSRFFVLEDGRFRNKRIEKERRKVEEISEKRRRNSKERWAASSENNDLAKNLHMHLHTQ